MRFNPATSPAALANIVKDMHAPVARKLKLFPDDHRKIVDARVVLVGKDFRIEVAATTFQ